MAKMFLAICEDLTVDSKMLDSVPVIPGYILKKADSLQNSKISKKLKEFYPYVKKQESEWQETPENGSVGKSIEDPNDFKYWIIEILEEVTYPDKKFLLAIHLSKIDLNFLIFSSVTAKSSSLDGCHIMLLEMFLFTYAYYYQNSPTKKIFQENITEIQEIYQKLIEFDEKNYPFILQALMNFDKLKSLPHNSPFKIVAIFSILEFLLTYQKKDRGLSISEQIKNSVDMLNNKFKEKTDFKKILQCKDGTPERTLIGKLYDYRNDIAHGNIPDFISELKLLREEKIIYNCLYDFLKKLLIYSLKDTSLIKSLRDKKP